MSLPIVSLRDAGTGASAHIVAGYGFNCYSFQACHDGQTWEVLWSDPEIVNGRSKASHSGVPLLFPFPGRAGRGVHLRRAPL